MDREDRLLAYMQGRLAGPDQSDFEAEVQSDRALAAEVDVLHAVKSEFRRESEPGDLSKGWDRLSDAIDNPVPVAANDNRFPRLSLIQVAAVVVAAVMIWEVAVAPSSMVRGPAEYQTVSENAADPVLQVILKETATIGDVATILRDLDGTITGGPSAVGIYRVSFPDVEALHTAQQALARRSDLFELVLEE